MKKLVMKKTARVIGEYMNTSIACIIVSIIVFVIGVIFAMLGEEYLMLIKIGFIGTIISSMICIGLGKILEAVVDDMEIHMNMEEEGEN